VTWVAAGAVEGIPRRGARVVRLAGQDIAVFRTGDDRVYALRDRCPHRGGPLSQGIVHGHRVTCPLHDWVIDLTDGTAAGPDEGCTPIFKVRIEDGQLFVDVPTGASHCETRRAQVPLRVEHE
jgi:nitrite reductase (NADH) small subunit